MNDLFLDKANQLIQKHAGDSHDDNSHENNIAPEIVAGVKNKPAHAGGRCDHLCRDKRRIFYA